MRPAATNYAYSYGTWQVSVLPGNTATGSQSITLFQGAVTLPDGRTIDDLSLDGQFLLTQDVGSGGFFYEHIFDAAGNLLSNFNAQAILKPSKAQAEWCSFSADGKTATCSAGVGASGSIGTGKLAACHRLFTIDLTVPAFPAHFRTCTDGDVTGGYEGQPLGRYAYRDASGLDHVLFRSDKTGVAEVYEAVWKP